MSTRNHTAQASRLAHFSNPALECNPLFKMLNPRCKQVLLWLSLLLAATAAPAQNYSINWSAVSGGGSVSTGGGYSVSGTIGQHDAGGPMTGGSYTLTSGFWSLISMVETPGLPDLTIAHSDNGVVVSWPNTGTYTLQQNSNLATGSWTASGYSITTANGTNSITITLPTSNLFFRLKQQDQ